MTENNEEKITIEHVPDPNEEAAKKSEDELKKQREAGSGIQITPAGGEKKQAAESIDDVKSRLEAVEKERDREQELRKLAERDRDSAVSKISSTRNEVAKAEEEKIAAQAASIDNKLSAAKAEVERIERDLESAMDGGKSNKEVIELNKKLAEAMYEVKGVESVKKNFEVWRENNKKAAEARPTQNNDDGMTPATRKWVDENPRFNTDPKFYRTAVGAHYEALKNGLKADSTEYFNHINGVLRDEGLLEDPNKKNDVQPNNNDGGGNQQRPKVPAGNFGAPVNNEGGSGGGGNGGGNRGGKVVRLTSEMREMALRTYGPGTKYDLKPEDALQRYAKAQMEIAERRARGEKI